MDGIVVFGMRTLEVYDFLFKSDLFENIVIA